jgi:hypothetical protein
MRFSIVYDENGTILAAAIDGENANKLPRSGASVAHLDIPEQSAYGELRKTVEDLLLDIDPRKLVPPGEEGDGQS